ncbi:MAG: M48 family metalloprotease [Aeromicrobium sp.]|nr:M48 family metalloprotease [Burkholderiales bacterium]
MKMMLIQIFLVFVLGTLPFSAEAQFGNFNLNKLIDTTKKLAEGTKDITEAEEISMGDGIAAMILGASPLHADQNLQRYVNRVGRWVASQSSRPDLPWTFGVIDTPTINAFALPGGKVFVSIGLVKRLNNESELAGVLAHEIAHVMQRHQVKAIQSARTSSAVQGIAESEASDRIARSGAGRNALTGALANAAAGEAIDFVKNGAFLRPLDKALEFEADRIGATLAARAGYDPYGLVSAIQILSGLKSEDSGMSLLMSTHPTPNNRLIELEKFSATLDKYSSQPQVTDRFAAVMANVK